MTDTSHRLYAVVVAAVVFLVSWAAVAAQPWSAPKQDPRLAALAQREQRLRTDAVIVKQVVAQRLTDYQVALQKRQAEIAAARAQSLQAAQAAQPPATAAAVRVVQLPPLTVTRSS